MSLSSHRGRVGGRPRSAQGLCHQESTAQRSRDLPAADRGKLCTEGRIWLVISHLGRQYPSQQTSVPDEAHPCLFQGKHLVTCACSKQAIAYAQGLITQIPGHTSQTSFPSPRSNVCTPQNGHTAAYCTSPSCDCGQAPGGCVSSV